MIVIDDVRGELEYDLAWRLEELRFFRNVLQELPGEADRSRYRRALVLILYAHYEGFVKIALEIFIKHISNENLPCGSVTPAIRAASWARLFQELANPSTKCKLFKYSLPEDEKLHRFAREREFAERLQEFSQTPIKLDSSHLVHTEANLWPVVIRKNLYKLGLHHEALAAHDSSIYELLNRRNGIAHGDDTLGLDEKQYQKIEDATIKVMEGVRQLIIDALSRGAYLVDTDFVI